MNNLTIAQNVKIFSENGKTKFAANNSGEGRKIKAFTRGKVLEVGEDYTLVHLESNFNLDGDFSLEVLKFDINREQTNGNIMNTSAEERRKQHFAKLIAAGALI